MPRSAEKKERALGAKLGLKPFRCQSPKCVMIRRPQRPGVHGKARRRAPSEFGGQLLEKQRLMITYGLRDDQLRRVFEKASGKTGSLGETILSLLESRLDNVVFRMGFAPSRVVGRQIVGHGHIFVNNKKVAVPSYEVKVGDAITIRGQSQNYLIFNSLRDTLKKSETPEWLELNRETLEGKLIAPPANIETPFDINAVVDYYSK